MGKTVLERKVFHKDDILMKVGVTHPNAYIVQKGEIGAFTHQNKIEIARYGPGEIIAENNLFLDDPVALSFEALKETTTFVVSRVEFEYKLSVSDSAMVKIITTLLKKLNAYEKDATAHAIQEKLTDQQAHDIVEHLLRDMSSRKRKDEYRDVLLPHFNIMVKALNDLKTKDRHEKQKEDLEKKQKEILGSDEEDANHEDSNEE